jgi:hypothetical protein
MSVRAVIVGVCMFACIQGYWNGPMGLMHGGAVMLAVGSI